MEFRGKVWLHVPSGTEPLHLGKIWKHADGRWNECGEYPCLYTALTREGALAELKKARSEKGDAEEPRDVVSVEVRCVGPVIDLRDDAACQALADAADCTHERALLIEDSKRAFVHCRALGRQARRDGYTAMIVPSAAAEGEANLVIYFDVVPSRQVDVDTGPDRDRIDAD
jgi:RES domain-containing protein